MKCKCLTFILVGAFAFLELYLVQKANADNWMEDFNFHYNELKKDLAEISEKVEIKARDLKVKAEVLGEEIKEDLKVGLQMIREEISRLNKVLEASKEVAKDKWEDMKEDVREKIKELEDELTELTSEDQ